MLRDVRLLRDLLDVLDGNRWDLLGAVQRVLPVLKRRLAQALLVESVADT